MDYYFGLIRKGLEEMQPFGYFLMAAIIGLNLIAQFVLHHRHPSWGIQEFILYFYVLFRLAMLAPLRRNDND